MRTIVGANRQLYTILIDKYLKIKMSYNYQICHFIYIFSNQLIEYRNFSRIIKIDRLKEEYHAYRTRERHNQTNGAIA